MKTRTLIVWPLIVMLVGSGLLWLSPGGTAEETTPVAKLQPTPPDAPSTDAPVREPGRTSPSADSARASPEDPAKARATKVQAALERFHERTAFISPEHVQASLVRVAEAKKAYEARPTPTPKVEPYEDAHGTRWQRLTYENGEVLYVPAPE